MVVVFKRFGLTLSVLLLALLVAPVVYAQTTNPTTVQFTPSPDQNSVGSNGLPVLDHYNLLVYPATGTQPVKTLNIGKPSPDADGYIRYNFSGSLSSWALPAGTYFARVDAVGPFGDGLSVGSNTFSLGATCTYSLSSIAASFPSTGDSGSVGVTTQAGCTWTTTSNATWITVMNGAGTGSGTATYSVAVNGGSTTRTGTLTIAGTSYTVTQSGTATTPTTTSALPSPWRNQDIGSVGVAGSATYAPGAFTVKGSGADIWGTADAFQYVYQPLAGDGQIVARVTGLTNTDSNAKAGVMLRETLTAGSRSIILDAKPGGGIEFMARSTTGGSTAYLAGSSLPRPVWLKLSRAGSTVTASVSADGTTWTLVGTTSVSMAASIYVGLAVTSHTTATLNTATFDNVSVALPTAPLASLPSPWATRDIGSVGIAGSTSYASGVFTVKAAGADIWGTADSFRFVYRALNGDGQIVARVTGLTNTQWAAKAGVMLRETLGSGSAGVILDMKPGGGIEFMARPSTGASTTYLAGATQAAPAWLKLVRSGTTIVASVSADGSSWRTVGTTNVSMASTIYVGLAVTSHTTSALTTATIDNVVVQ